MLTRYRRELNEYLRSLVSAQHPPALYRMIRYHLGWEDAEGRSAKCEGKGLRPTLCLLACAAVGGDWRRALPAAAAVELVHSFSLVHDDIQDRDTVRHGRPTVWSVWGEAQAINAGDALLALARLSILRLTEAGVPDGLTLEAAQVLDERTLEMVEGQTLDLSFEQSLDVDLEAYLEMIEKKTGALFDCSLGLGALIGGAHTPIALDMGRVGRLLGSAFQIRDDMLGVWGAENRTGKTPAADIRRRKKSLPVVYALAHGDGPARDHLQHIYAKAELADEDVSLVLKHLDGIAAQAFCAKLSRERANDALNELDRLPLTTDAVADLRSATLFLLERNF